MAASGFFRSIGRQQLTPPLKIRRIAGSLGAEIAGLGLSQEPGVETCAAIERALDRHKVVSFRDQAVAPEPQIAFSAGIGPVFTDHPAYLPTLEGDPEIVVREGQEGAVRIRGTRMSRFLASLRWLLCST